MNKISNPIDVENVIKQLNTNFGEKSKYSVDYIKEVLCSVNDLGMNATSKKYNISKSTIRMWRNPGRNKEYLKQQYNKNRDIILKKKKEIYLKNPQKRISINNKHAQKRYHNDSAFRMLSLLRTRTWKTLADQNIIKNSQTISFLGCNLETFKRHIESKFLNGMSWENYGTWHIDHIIPCSKFDLSKEDEQRKCFHFTNLRPLWAKDNLLKSNNLPTLALINCASAKKGYDCKASEMYEDSALFRTMKEYAKNNANDYRILSSYYGLLHPDEIISPYPHTVMFSTPSSRALNAINLTVEQKKQWAEKVFKSLDWTKYSMIYCWIGRYYWEYLESFFIENNIPFIYQKMPQGIGNTINKFN